MTLRAMVGGEEVVDVNVENRALPIRLASVTTAITSPADLELLSVRTASGGLTPLSSIVCIEEEGVAAQLYCVEQRRAI